MRKDKEGIVLPMVQKQLQMLRNVSSEANANFIEILLSFIIFGGIYKKEKRLDLLFVFALFYVVLVKAFLFEDPYETLKCQLNH
jgi:hypothetical protein